MQVIFVQVLAFIINAAIYKRKKKVLQPMNKKKKKKKKSNGIQKNRGPEPKVIEDWIFQIDNMLWIRPQVQNERVFNACLKYYKIIKWSTSITVS